MPTKVNSAGKQQSYDPKTGRYGEGDSVESSSNPIDLIKPIPISTSIKQPRNEFTSSSNPINLVNKEVSLEEKYGLTPSDIAYNRELDSKATPNPSPVRHKEAFQASKTIFQRASQKAKTITPMIQQICESLGGEMVGLEFQLKRENSLARKISGEMDDGYTLEDASKRISDSLRFTSVIEADKFTDHVTRVTQELEKRGFKIAKRKNNFIGKDGKPSTGYKDINMNFEDPSGFIFELQFNTPEGIKAKEGLVKENGRWTSRKDGVKTSHFYYEQSRVLDENDPANAKRIAYLKYMTEKVWRDVPIPKGIESIKTVDKK